MQFQFRLFFILLLICPICHAADALSVRSIRVPGGGIQPQVAVDAKGVVHLICLKGDPTRSDILYMRSTDAGRTFSMPIRVNSQPGSALAIGTVRGAHMALGSGGRVHVAWMGSQPAEPKATGKATPMLYTRSTEDGASFEPQRNLIQSHTGLDGGGSITADPLGNVYVTWHAPLVPGEGEQSRRVWLARSADGGATFSTEQPISPEAGACGCCGMRIFATNGSLYVLYRGVDQDKKIERDMTLLRLDAKGGPSRADIVGKMQSPICTMSTSAMAASPRAGVIAAWETNGQIFWSSIDGPAAPVTAIAVPGQAGGRKHPAVAANAAGQVLVVWTEGTGWQKGGSIAWQIYDNKGEPLPGGAGRADRLPAWGTPGAFVGPDGSFVIVY
jgi:hypothetical protein